MSKRELIKPHANDARYQRRDAKGQFSDSDDVGKSLQQDRLKKSRTKAPRGEGDKGDH